MRLIFKVVVVVAVVALLILGGLSYLENWEGEATASAILEDIKGAGATAWEAVVGFFDKSGIKQGAADLMEQGAAAIKGSPSPETTTPLPGYSPAPGEEE